MVRKWWDLFRLRRLGVEPNLIRDVEKFGSLDAVCVHYERRISTLLAEIKVRGVVA